MTLFELGHFARGSLMSLRRRSRFNFCGETFLSTMLLHTAHKLDIELAYALPGCSISSLAMRNKHRTDVESVRPTQFASMSQDPECFLAKHAAALLGSRLFMSMWDRSFGRVLQCAMTISATGAEQPTSGSALPYIPSSDEIGGIVGNRLPIPCAGSLLSFSALQSEKELRTIAIFIISEAHI